MNDLSPSTCGDSAGASALQSIPAKQILIRNKDLRWFGAAYNMNLYRGCVHGCIYCDSRSACYRIEHFESVCCKENALSLLEQELARKRTPGVIATGAMSDPYNPFEKEAKLTRNALKIIDKYQHGIAFATKSDLCVRDLDIFDDINRHSPTLCKITITCLDDRLAGKIEPHAPSSSRRFSALEAFAARGIFCGILLMPILPFLNDTAENIIGIVRRAADCGARFIYPGFGVTMRTGQREYTLNQLDRLFPGEKMSDKYHNKYGNNYYCGSPRAGALWEEFQSSCRQYGILYEMPEIIEAYQKQGGFSQLSFF